MKSYWHDARPSGRNGGNAEPFEENPVVENPIRPSQNIEGVECGAMDHRKFGQEDDLGLQGTLRKHTSQRWMEHKHKPTAEGLHDQPIEYADFFIDPITNRRVPKHTFWSNAEDGTDTPVKTFKAYRSTFVKDDDISKQRNEDLQRVPKDEDSNSSDIAQDYQVGQDLRKLRPETENPASIPTDGVSYDDLLRYKPFQNPEFGENLASNAKKLSEDLDSRSDYQHVLDETHKKFDDLMPPNDNIETGGCKPLVVDELASRVQHAETYEVDQGTREADDKPEELLVAGLSDEVGNPEDLLYKYPTGITIDQIKEEIRVFLKGDDETLTLPPMDSETRKSIHKICVGLNVRFKSTGWDDQRRPLLRRTKRIYPYTKEVELLLSKLTEGNSLERGAKSMGFNDESVTPQVLSQYRSFIDFEATEPENYLELTGKDLRARYAESRPEKSSDLQDGHEPVVSDAANGEDHDQSETSEIKYHALEEYPVLETDPALQESDVQAAYDISSSNALGKDDGFTSGRVVPEKLNSVYRGQGRKATSLGRNSPEETDGHAMTSTELLERLSSVKDDLEKLAPDGQDHGLQRKHYDGLETSAKKHEQVSDAHDEKAALAVKSAKARSQEGDVARDKMTGNYVRDFPEEFEKNWTQTLSSAQTGADTFPETGATAESESMDGGLEGAFGRPAPPKIQPALDRHKGTKAATEQEDFSSDEAQSLETSHSAALGEDSQLLLDVNQHGTAIGAENDMFNAVEEVIKTTNEDSTAAVNQTKPASRETVSGSDGEPVLYKILAYDPTMQEIKIAQTSSMVPDFASALSPADALLRLSHPTRFFPHFAGLEAEGFEIASGSGDVLVFRKARPSEDARVKDTAIQTAETTSHSQSTERRVNPIDMTGRVAWASPASANFASPTGYVKYENLPETEASNLPPPPRVAYNINLRREEPVYSGPKHNSYGEKKQKSRLGKRLLVGGVWFAGISYGLGVISEYFTTGGIDGLGPQGL
ncbi:unnamed protein product [Discula destructiva]